MTGARGRSWRGAQIRYNVLGPFTAWRGEQQIALGWAKQQAVLVVLLLEMNRPVPVHTIIDAVWGDDHLPGDARKAVQTYVSRLRRALQIGVEQDDTGPGLMWTEAGYVLRGDPTLLDLDVFEHLLAKARVSQARGDRIAAIDHINEALSLWKGEPFSGLSGPAIEAERRRLHECRLAALEQRASIQMEMGRHKEFVAELTHLVSTHPTHERLRALLMLALYRSGRQADALDLYHETRRRLANEFGLEPGPELQQVHQRILRGETYSVVPAQQGKRDAAGRGRSRTARRPL